MPLPICIASVRERKPRLSVIVAGLARVTPYSQKAKMPALTLLIQENYQKYKHFDRE